jgi:hypothetical protein
MSALLQDMGIDHGRRDILMPKQRLNGPNVGSFFKKVVAKLLRTVWALIFLGIL